MPETAVTLTSNSPANSSGPGSDALEERTPAQLVDDGYTEHVHFRTSLGQVAALRGESVQVREQNAQAPSTTFVTREADVISFPAQTRNRRRVTTLHPLQEWEGWVTEIGNEDFTARLLDLTAAPITVGASRMEEAVIPFSEILDDDRKKMREGSIFRWVIGYERSASGTKRRVSQIVFRDLPVVTREQITLGQEWAKSVAGALKE